jgi:hypothetical protein
MKGDFTRDTFDPNNHYQQVLMQQGRAQLDADWNEQGALSKHRDEAAAADLIGECGGPADHAAFGVFTDTSKLTAADQTHLADLGVHTPLAGGDFFLSAGHYYVDGILCENEWAIPYTAQPDRIDVETLNPGSYILYLDVWRRHITALDASQILESALGGPDTATRAKTIWQVRALPIVSVDLDNPCGSGDLSSVLDPNTALLTASTVPTEAPDDPCIVPPGGGYVGLENQLYRVEIHEPGKALDAKSSTGSEAVTLPATDSPQNEVIVTSTNWTEGEVVEVYPSKTGSPVMAGQLAYVTAVDNASKKLTLNVPVKDLVADDLPRIRHIEGATWKWSRENGSVITAIENIDGNKITVSTLGPDANLGFGPGAWVEILGEIAELDGTPGQLVQIDDVDESSRVITLKSGAVALAATDRHPKLRRWEGVAAVKYVTPENSDSNWLPLENGVQVRFARNGDYRTGHYWQIPARTASAGSPNGKIEWRLDKTGKPIALPPQGITHYLCRLGIVTIAEDDSFTFYDCRCLYPALTSVPRLFYVSGDGQEVMPDLIAANGLYKLPQPLIVGVANAQCLEQPLTVGFGVTQGNGGVVAFGGLAADINAVVNLTTDPNGLAKCHFYLENQTYSQQVTAQLLDADGNPVSLPIIFNSNLSIASQVAYDPGACSGLAGEKTVQDAIAQIASMAHLEMVSGDGQDAAPGVQLTFPLQVSVSSKCGPIKGATVKFTAGPNDPNGIITPATTTTDANGLASCQWTPPPTVGGHQLTADLTLTPDGQAIEEPAFVQFTANVRTINEGSCCCVTIGAEGDFKNLNEAIVILMEKEGLSDICICFLPGDHEIPKDLTITAVPDKPGGQDKFKPTYVKISGCGPATRLALKAPLNAFALASFSLDDLLISVENIPNPIIINECSEVDINGCELKQSAKIATDFVIIGNATRITIADNLIEVVNTQKNAAAALVIADANAETEIRNNIIRGQVRFYGSDGLLSQEAFNKQVAAPIRGKVQIESNDKAPDARIESNTLEGVVVDKLILKSIIKTGDSTVLTGLFRRFSLLNNTIISTTNAWLGVHVISNGNFLVVPEAVVGTAAGETFICIGTSAADPAAVFQYSVPNAIEFSEAANLIGLVPV